MSMKLIYIFGLLLECFVLKFAPQGLEEMAQQFTALAAIAEDWNSVPSTHS